MRKPGTKVVFLSHKFEDKPHCRKIAEYIQASGVSTFFDEQDETLQMAVEKDAKLFITERIKQGIAESTHLLVVISPKTRLSMWVPFEIGYAHARLVDKAAPIPKLRNIKVAVLLIDGMERQGLPEFLQMAYLLEGIDDLDNYLAEINKKKMTNFKEDLMDAYQGLKTGEHPLEGLLKK